MLQSLILLSSNLSFPFSHPYTSSPFLSSSSYSYQTFQHRPTTIQLVSANSLPEKWVAQLPELFSMAVDDEGPIELPPSSNSIFSTNDDPSTLQVATSVLLTGAITIFLFRSLRRRAKRAKELRFRSSGAKKTLKEEALDNLKAMRPGELESQSPPSAVQALLGGVSAGIIALVLYKFTTTIEASLNRQTISDNFSVRQITVTIRTIINGLCYLATFVFGLNSVGLFLYSGQLAISSFMEDSTGGETKSTKEEVLSSSDSVAENTTDSSDNDKNSNDTQ